MTINFNLENHESGLPRKKKKKHDAMVAVMVGD
jgi:hypothetical protein